MSTFWIWKTLPNTPWRHENDIYIYKYELYETYIYINTNYMKLFRRCVTGSQHCKYKWKCYLLPDISPVNSTYQQEWNTPHYTRTHQCPFRRLPFPHKSLQVGIIVSKFTISFSLQSYSLGFTCVLKSYWFMYTNNHICYLR